MADREVLTGIPDPREWVDRYTVLGYRPVDDPDNYSSNRKNILRRYGVETPDELPPEGQEMYQAATENDLKLFQRAQKMAQIFEDAKEVRRVILAAHRRIRRLEAEVDWLIGLVEQRWGLTPPAPPADSTPPT